jgi:DNA invertase Pin-like site-specific DNA recombinase
MIASCFPDRTEPGDRRSAPDYADSARKVTFLTRNGTTVRGINRQAEQNADWHRLLQICAFNNTLILDEDGLYDPCNFNDWLLPGLKGTMSEAELYLIRARLRGRTSRRWARARIADSRQASPLPDSPSTPVTAYP